MAVVHAFLSLLLLLSSFHYRPARAQNPTRSALLKFKDSLSNSDSLTNWKDSSSSSSSSPCDLNDIWVGIVCDKDTVTSINLANMGLQGRPNVAALAPLEQLESISLQNNSLIGPIPAFNLLPSSLTAIYASENKFSGVVPPRYFHPFRRSLKRVWLSRNRFHGPVPMSLGQLINLKELHLENNEFSGPIPDFSKNIDVLEVVDLSNNKLVGPIPARMNKFDKEAFENNPGLCGPKASKLCPSSDENTFAKLIIAAIVVILLLLIISVKDNKKEEKMRISRKESIKEAVVTIPNVTRKSSTSRKPGFGSLSKTRTKTRTKDARSSPRSGLSGSQPVGEVVMVNEEKGVFGSQDLMKASAEVLGNGGLGSAYKATLTNGLSVVLKRMKEMNTMSKDVFAEEMRKLGRLKHQNILTPLAYHFRKEDKFLVSEYVPKGSLHNALHGGRGTKHSELSWPNRLKMIQGVARAMAYLHSELESYELPHGNLKSSNVLIGQDYEPLVTDYALHPLINSTRTAQSMFAYRSPEALHQQPVSHKTDVYCLGIIILEVVTGRYPSQYVTNNQKGESGTDVVQWVRSALDENRESELIDPELEVKDCVGQIEKLLRIGAACTERNVDTRIDTAEAVTRIEDL